MIFDKTSIAFQINQFLSVQSDKSLKEAFQEEHFFQQDAKRFSLLEFIAKDNLEDLIQSNKIDIPWNKKFNHSFDKVGLPEKLTALEIVLLTNPQLIEKLIDESKIKIKRNQIDDFVYHEVPQSIVQKINPSQSIFNKIISMRNSISQNTSMKP